MSTSGLWWMISHSLGLMTRDVLVNRVGGSVIMPYPVRFLIYRAYGIGTKTINIKSQCWFTGNTVLIGRGAFINHRCYFDNLAPIKIGARCRIGMEVMFCTSTHEIGTGDQRAGAARGFPIRVGDGCWIGARAIIMPGVSIGDGCVVAAGAIVTKNCEAHGLYAGVPATRMRDLPCGQP